MVTGTSESTLPPEELASIDMCAAGSISTRTGPPEEDTTPPLELPATNRTVVQVPGDHSLRTDLEAVAAEVRAWLPQVVGLAAGVTYER